MSASSIIIDIVIAAVLIFSVTLGAKRGFAAVVLNLAAFLLALSLATALLNPLADYCYGLMEGKIADSVNSAVTDSKVKVDKNIKKTVDKAFDSLPDYIRSSVEYLGYSADNIGQYISDSFESGSKISLGDAIADAVKPAVMQIIKLPLFLVMFAVFEFVLKLAARLIGNAFSIPVINGVNRFLGGVLGLVRGLLTALIITLFASGFIWLTDDKNEFLNTEVISESIVFNVFYSYNPFINIVDSK